MCVNFTLWNKCVTRYAIDYQAVDLIRVLIWISQIIYQMRTSVDYSLSNQDGQFEASKAYCWCTFPQQIVRPNRNIHINWNKNATIRMLGYTSRYRKPLRHAYSWTAPTLTQWDEFLQRHCAVQISCEMFCIIHTQHIHYTLYI